jgi:hypothetical protein
MWARLGQVNAFLHELALGAFPGGPARSFL